jgi:hypothetical protein
MTNQNNNEIFGDSEMDLILRDANMFNNSLNKILNCASL